MPSFPKTPKPPYRSDKVKQHTGRIERNMKFYNKAKWRKLSKSYRTKYPLCEISLKKGLTIPCDCVDHIIPINQGGAPFDERNLQALSHREHNKKSAKETHGIISAWILNEYGYKIPANNKIRSEELNKLYNHE